jgi:hypothetical protein
MTTIRRKKLMTRDDAARIQRAACNDNNGVTPPNSFASRAMRAAYTNEPLPSESETRLANSSPSAFFLPPAREEPKDNNDALFAAVTIGAGLLAAGATGWIAYKMCEEEQRRREEEQKSCCERYCRIM